MSFEKVDRINASKPTLGRTWLDEIALSLVPHVILSAFPPFQLIYVNHAWQDTWGFQEQDVIGSTMQELLYGDLTSPECIRRIDNAFHSYHAARVAIVHYNSVGIAFVDKFRVCPVFDEFGMPSGHFVGISEAVFLYEVPVQSLCHTESESKWCDSELQSALDTQLNGLKWTPFFLIDTCCVRPRIVWASPAVDALFGFTSAELLALGSHDALYAPDADSSVIAAVERSMWQGQSATAIVRCRRRDGAGFWNRVSAQPCTLHLQGEVLTCYCVAHYGVTGLLDRALRVLAAAAARDAATRAAGGLVGSDGGGDPREAAAAARAALLVDDLQLGTQRGVQDALDRLSRRGRDAAACRPPSAPSPPPLSPLAAAAHGRGRYPAASDRSTVVGGGIDQEHRCRSPEGEDQRSRGARGWRRTGLEAAKLRDEHRQALAVTRQAVAVPAASVLATVPVESGGDNEEIAATEERTNEGWERVVDGVALGMPVFVGTPALALPGLLSR